MFGVVSVCIVQTVFTYIPLGSGTIGTQWSLAVSQMSFNPILYTLSTANFIAKVLKRRQAQGRLWDE